jgi:hypothetical protein
MKIAPPTLPRIAESMAVWSHGSQETIITPQEASLVMEPNIHDIQAARLQRQMKNAQFGVQQPIRPPQPETQSPIKNTWKNICHKAAMTCGVLFLPSFACLAFGLIGLIVPASLLVFGIALAIAGGKPTEKIERANAERAVEMSQYDPR